MATCPYGVVFPPLKTGVGSHKKKPEVKAGFYIYKVSEPSLLLSLYRHSLQFSASLATVHYASCWACGRLNKLFDRNALKLQYLTPPKLFVARLILTPGCCSLGSEECLQIRFGQNGSLFACCHSRIAPGIESRRQDFFSFLSIYPICVLLFRVSDDILHGLVSWTWDVRLATRSVQITTIIAGCTS